MIKAHIAHDTLLPHVNNACYDRAFLVSLGNTFSIAFIAAVRPHKTVT